MTHLPASNVKDCQTAPPVAAAVGPFASRATILMIPVYRKMLLVFSFH